MRNAYRIELMKLRRSVVARVTTALMVVLVPALGAAFTQVALSESAGGPLGGKASALLIGDGWTAHLRMIDQIAAVAIFIGVGIVAAWAFGREFADGTFPALFGLPVSRSTIARAKFLALSTWGVVVVSGVVVVALAIGVPLGVEGDLVGAEVARLAAITAGGSMLGSTAGLVASVGRGHLPAIGAIILAVVAAQVAVLFGSGGWFPFAVPGLASVAGVEGIDPVTIPQSTLVPITAVAASWSTIGWWSRAEA